MKMLPITTIRQIHNHSTSTVIAPVFTPPVMMFLWTAVSTSMASVLLLTDLALTECTSYSGTPCENTIAALAPTDNAGTVIPDGAVAVYGGDTNIGTNYDPGWGQSGNGQVDPAYDPGTGDLVLAYPNFNYQGTEMILTDLSDMGYLHVDIWVPADTARIVKVTPVNNGTGATEFLVEVPITPGAWNNVDLPQSAFTGMTWDSVIQMKSDGQFNADGTQNTAPFDIYLDNIYFWSDGGPADVLGCIDENATNYDDTANTQSLDQYGNSTCIYASCDDVPVDGCIYVDGFGPFVDGFGPSECTSYSGTPCENATADIEGCIDENATNYDANATVQAVDQYGNQLCVYASCDDVPSEGCRYDTSFAP